MWLGEQALSKVLSFRVLKFVRMWDKSKILRVMILAATSLPRPLDKPQGGPEADFFAQPSLTVWNTVYQPACDETQNYERDQIRDFLRDETTKGADHLINRFNCSVQCGSMIINEQFKYKNSQYFLPNLNPHNQSFRCIGTFCAKIKLNWVWKI